jgi:hypothetical protein
MAIMCWANGDQTPCKAAPVATPLSYATPCGLLDEVLAQHGLLPLVAGPHVLLVQHVRIELESPAR